MYAKSFVGAAAIAAAACAFGAGTAAATTAATIGASGSTITAHITGAVAPVSGCSLAAVPSDHSSSGYQEAGTPDGSGIDTIEITGAADGQYDVTVTCSGPGGSSTIATQTVTLPAAQTGSGSLSSGSLGSGSLGSS